MKTYAVICEGIVWKRDPSFLTPGLILPDAKEKLTELMAYAVVRPGQPPEPTNRVVLVSPCFNTYAGHKRAWSELFHAEIPYSELHTAPGFPEYDEVLYHVPKTE